MAGKYKILFFSSLIFLIFFGRLLAAVEMRKEPYLIYMGVQTEIHIMWQLTEKADCLIEWGVDESYSTGSVVTEEYGDDHQHSYNITNLRPGSSYLYRVTVNGQYYTGSFRVGYSNDDKLKFMVYGDSRFNPTMHNEIAGAMLTNIDPILNLQTLIFSTGDLVTFGELESAWDEELFNFKTENIKEMLANAPYQACIGNHDLPGDLFRKYFPYPFVADHYWSFDYGSAHFVILDQYAGFGPLSEQYSWLENDLSSTDKTWKFVFFHEPGWSAGLGVNGGHEDDIYVQEYLQPLFELYNVTIIFTGHNHYYARAVVDGINHITTGGGGAPLHGIEFNYPDEEYPNVVTASNSYHYCRVTIDGNSLYFSALDADSNVIDVVSINNAPDEENDINIISETGGGGCFISTAAYGL
jgi:hypothetical protein